MTNNALPLSAELRCLSEAFENYSVQGMMVDPRGCAAISLALEQFCTRAAELERAESALQQMEAIARDLDVVTHLRDMRMAVEALPGSNVVLWPIAPRPVPPTGGDAA